MFGSTFCQESCSKNMMHDMRCTICVSELNHRLQLNISSSFKCLTQLSKWPKRRQVKTLQTETEVQTLQTVGGVNFLLVCRGKSNGGDIFPPRRRQGQVCIAFSPGACVDLSKLRLLNEVKLMRSNIQQCLRKSYAKINNV